MNDDSQLLGRYASQRDEGAFREVVNRHAGLVYAAALRQVNGDAHLAADVAQSVFRDLAVKAASLTRCRVLGAWLLTSTRYAAAKAVRGEQRRRRREQEAELMRETDNVPDADWTQLRPLLDEVLAGLSDADREAIVLRYFEGRDYAAVGARLEVSDNTARMRVERALDKLRGALARRGVVSTAVALAAAMSSHAVTPVPAGLAARLADVAVAEAARSSAAVLFMGMTKLQVGMTAAIVAAGTFAVVAQSRSNAELKDEITRLERDNQRVTEQIASEQTDRIDRTRRAAALRVDAADWNRLDRETAELRRQVATARTAQAAPAQPEDRLPQLRQPPRVVYPEALLASGTSGEVTVDFIVDDKGAVRNAYAVKATQPEFATAAVAGVSESVFDNGVKRGRAVNTHMQIRIVFDAAKRSASHDAPEPVMAAPKNG